jgi:hypothetical protein
MSDDITFTNDELNHMEHQKKALESINAMKKFMAENPNITKWLMILGPFNRLIPLIITSVTVGVAIVNRTFMKILGHLIGAILAGVITIFVAIFAELVPKVMMATLFVTAFLGYTIAYVFMCFKNGMPDTVTIVGMVLGFASLLFVNMFVSLQNDPNRIAPYFGTILLSALAGVGGVYATESIGGTAYLYDFKGCSCDDCASSNTSICDNNKVVMLKKKTNI